MGFADLECFGGYVLRSTDDDLCLRTIPTLLFSPSLARPFDCYTIYLLPHFNDLTGFSWIRVGYKLAYAQVPSITKVL